LGIDGGGSIRDFQDLEVWQMAMDLSERIYRLTWEFPRHELYGLASQLQRASVSIPSNIAEGRMRGTLRDYAHFVSMARGSLAEVRTQLILAQRLEYASADDVMTLLECSEHLARRLNALRRSLLTRLETEHDPVSNRHPKPKTQNLKPVEGALS
jgi:carbamoyl-phosphate synthase large subunit